jgi:hypothetical protein
MSVRPAVLGIVTVLSLAAITSEVRAESPVVEKIVALNKGAITALQAGAHEKAKTQLMEAVVLGKENGLGMHAAMARTYLHLGVLYTDGFKDKEKALRNFALALKVRPDIELTPALASKTVQAAFAEARGEKPGEKPAARPEKAPEPKAAAAPAPAAAARASDKEKDRLQKSLAEKDKALVERDKRLAEKDKALAEKDKALAERDKALAEKDKALAEKDKALVERDKRLAEKEKALADKEKALAEAGAREKKEREARERFEKLNQENGKLLAEAAGREKKEREAREKVEKERLAAETREKERKDREEKERVARERLVEGPELPASIPQPLFCPTRDEAVVATELHIHCAPQGHVKAKTAVLYYRPSGVAHFNSLTMERSKKGWWTAAIPAGRVTGKTLQYYVEARGAKDEVAASNGKAGSPNLIVLRASAAELKAPAAPLAAAAPAPAKEKANAKAKAAGKTGRRTPAAHRQRTKPRP